MPEHALTAPVADPVPRGRPTAKLRLAVYKKAGYRCVGCGWAPEVPDGYDGRYTLGENTYNPRRKRLGCRLLELDHIHPHKHGGRYQLDNLQALCSVCNGRKGATI